MSGLAWKVWRAVPQPLRGPAHSVVALSRRLRAHTTPMREGPAPELPAAAVDLPTLRGGFWFDGTDEKVVPWVRRHATWEADVVRFLESNVKPGSVAVDVGANVGFHTAILSRLVGPTGTVDAFEPHPETIALLTANLWRHACDNTAVHPVAASDRPGDVFLETDLAGASGARLAEKGVTVQAVRLDDVLQPGPVDVLKIDVEGAEPLVLRGAAEVIARSPRLVAVVEFRAEQHLDMSTPEEVLELYAALGLDTYLLAASGETTPAGADEVLAAAAQAETINIVLRRSG